MNEHASHTSGTIALDAYSAAVKDTDVLAMDETGPVLMGLYGEVGGIMTTAKKLVREKGAFPDHRAAAQEEFGDALWYLAAYCRRTRVSLESIFSDATTHAPCVSMLAASDLPSGAVAHVTTPAQQADIDHALFQLGRAAAALLDSPTDIALTRARLVVFASCYLSTLHAAGFSFAHIARLNIAKTRGAFLSPDPASLPRFDDEFDSEEQLPSSFRIRIDQRSSGRSYMRWNGVFIGDPLTDSIGDPDGYRFHDVFHFAHAAILHWSPVFRALIKQKRKSSGRHDDAEDGGRAIVVEEGLTAWIFSRAKGLDYFDGQTRISLGLLKTIEEFTKGYEVRHCPLKLWENAILQGYAVFRSVREAKGGWVEGDRKSRTLRFEHL
ncbi:MAG: nucleoside triphosphate pyrophosphohydrolase family protein [Vicinamibacterales bacterium]